LYGYVTASFVRELYPLDFPIQPVRVEKPETVSCGFPTRCDEQLLRLVREFDLIQQVCGCLLQVVRAVLIQGFICDFHQCWQLDEVGLVPALVRDNILELVQQLEA
jgi:hypothetical protein